MKNYRRTDPEFTERLEHFAFDEVVNEEGQATATLHNRLEKGIEAQAAIFGDHMKDKKIQSRLPVNA